MQTSARRLFRSERVEAVRACSAQQCTTGLYLVFVGRREGKLSIV